MSITVTRHQDAPHRPSTMKVGKIRKDGKHKVTLWSCGGPNMFGGYNYSKARTHLFTPEKVQELVELGIYEVSYE